MNYFEHSDSVAYRWFIILVKDIPEGEGSGLDTRYAIFEPMLTGLFSRFLQGNSPNKNAVLEALSERRISLEDSLNIMEVRVLFGLWNMCSFLLYVVVNFDADFTESSRGC